VNKNDLNQAMTDAADPGDIRVSAPALLPFRVNPSCPKCGVHVPALSFLMNPGLATADLMYCVGSKNEKEDVHTPIGCCTVETGCFGLFAEHLHLRCRRCGFKWLSHTRGR